MKSGVTVDRMIVRCARLAMATRFEARLVGDDEEHLMVVGEAALDEISRIERLLSRFDPASEVARVNREAASHPVRVDRELFVILANCHDWFDRTDGYFDLCASGGPGSPRFGEVVRLDEESNSVTFLDPAARLDFGGYGKGYALDVAARVLDEFGVCSARLHGGTSSILARGQPEDGPCWRVEIRDPFETESGSVVNVFRLNDAAVSTSAVFDPGSTRSDIVDPIASRRLDRPAACSVVTSSATVAEVYSTALLAMGKSRASHFVRRGSPIDRVFWIERDGDRVSCEILGG